MREQLCANSHNSVLVNKEYNPSICMEKSQKEYNIYKIIKIQ